MLVKSTISLSISNIIFVLSGYFLNVWLARYLGPYEYGIYGLLISLIGLINVIQLQGIPQALTKLLSSSSKDNSSYLFSSWILQTSLSFIIVVIWILLTFTFFDHLFEPELKNMVLLSSMIFPIFGFFALICGYYNGIHDFKKLSIINSIFSVAKFIAVIIFSYFAHLPGVIIGLVITPISALLFGFKMPKKTSHNIPYRKIIALSIPLVLFSLLLSAQQTIDVILLKYFLKDNVSVGYYTSSQNIAKIPFFVLSSISVVLYPNIAKNISQNLHQNSRDLIHKSLRTIISVLIPASILAYSFSKSIVELIFSKTYLPAANSLAILVTAFSFLTVFNLFAIILNGSNNTGKSVFITILGIIVTSISCTLFIPRYGLEGAAVSTAVGALCAMTVSGFYVYKTFKALINPMRLLKLFAAAIITYLISQYMPQIPILIPVYSILLLLLYFTILIFLKEITKKELIILRNYTNFNRFKSR